MKPLTVEQRYMIAGIAGILALFALSVLEHGWIGLIKPPLVAFAACVIGYPILRWINKGEQ